VSHKKLPLFPKRRITENLMICWIEMFFSKFDDEEKGEI